jgi:hypothetical protein
MINNFMGLSIIKKQPMKTLLGLIITLLLGGNLFAQKADNALLAGYFGPYFTNVGGTVGYAFTLKTWEKTSANKRSKRHSLQLLPQVGYYHQPRVSHNVLFNPEVSYQWQKLDKRFCLLAAVGTAYQLTFKKEDGILNLGTGDIDYKYKQLHSFVPNISLGFGVTPRKAIGFYFKAYYGRQLRFDAVNTAFIGLSTGILINLKYKNERHD